LEQTPEEACASLLQCVESLDLNQLIERYLVME